jgi:hypothetical protein
VDWVDLIMHIDWQLLASFVIVAVAAAYIGRSFWRSLHPKKGDCGGCGCGRAPAAPEAQGQLISSASIQLRPARSKNRNLN